MDMKQNYLPKIVRLSLCIVFKGAKISYNYLHTPARAADSVCLRVSP